MEKTTYNFIDVLSQAKLNNKTLKEIILSHEALIEDARVPKAFGDEFTVMEAERRNQELFAKKMQKEIGDDSYDFNFVDNAPIGAFATNQLERLDMNVRRQALRTWATRDIPIVYGGGALESVKGFKELYQLPKGGFIGGDTNEVRLVKVDFKAHSVPVKPLTYGLRLGLVDSMKNGVIGFDAISKNGEVIQKAWALDLDRIAYVGERGENGSTADVAGSYRGLLNFENVDILDLEATELFGLSGAKRLQDYGINKVIEIFTHVLNKIALRIDFDKDLMINKILFYKEFYSYLNATATDNNGAGTPFRTNRVILQEAIDNWTQTQDFDPIKFEMLPYLSEDIAETKDPSMVSTGVNDTGRFVFYRQDPYSLYLPLPLELTGGAIVFDINTNAYRRNYLSFVGYLMNFYTDNIYYLDNGTSTNEKATITWDLSGGAVDGVSTAIADANALVGGYILDLSTKPTPTKTGKVLAGWAYDSAGTQPLTAKSKVTEADTIYAIWVDA